MSFLYNNTYKPFEINMQIINLNIIIKYEFKVIKRHNLRDITETSKVTNAYLN